MATGTMDLEAALAAFDELVMMGQPPDSGTFCARFPHLPDLPRHLQILRAVREELPPASAESLPPNRQLGEFELVRPLGRGGMGQVFLAWQRAPRRLCAVKVVRLMGQEILKRFRREAAMTSRLDHPNIAGVYGAGEVADWAYMALQLIYGSSLYAILGRTSAGSSEETWMRDVLSSASEDAPSRRRMGNVPIPSRIAIDIANQTAAGLAHAHERGIVHRDIKPTNIMVTSTGQVKVIDFGIALPWLDDTDHLTSAGRFIGSYDYAAPEQLHSDRATIGPWSDTYSLGATLFEMLTQRPPYTCANFVERVRLVDTPISAGPRQIAPDIPRYLDSLVRKALSLKPSDRFQDGAELAGALTEMKEAERKGRASVSVGPSFRSATAATSFRRRDVLWLGLCTFLLFWGFHQHAVRVGAQRAQAAREQLRDEAIADEILDTNKPALLQCITPTRKPSKINPSAPTPTLEAAATVSKELVQSVKVSPLSRNLSMSAKECMASEIKTFVFPGVGMLGPREVSLHLAFPADSTTPPHPSGEHVSGE